MRRGHRFGIRARAGFLLLLIFVSCASLLSLLVSRQMTTRLEERIREDMLRIWQDANLYSRQLLVTYGLNNDEEGFAAISQELGGSLSSAFERTMLRADAENSTAGSAGIGQLAKPDAASFTAGKEETGAVCRIHYGEGDTCVASALLPVVVEGRHIGALRVGADYTKERRENRRFVRVVLQITAVILAMAFLLCLLMLGGVLSPMLRLARLSARITELVDRREIQELPSPRNNLRNRPDEIGQLAMSYDRMIETVKEQFLREESDRKRILSLMEARQRFFDNSTHELKTPLTTIQGYAQLILEDEGRDRELFHTGMEHILRESGRLHRMVIQLLDLSDRRETEPFAPVDLSQLIREVTDSLQLKAKRYGNIFLLKLTEDGQLIGQDGALRQLLINLLDNAIKYGQEHAPIDVSLTGDTQMLLLHIGNRGAGIPQEAAEKIFQPFYRVDKGLSREQGSAGLGLSICQRIVRNHGGEITMHSEPGIYTEFFVTLPRTRRKP